MRVIPQIKLKFSEGHAGWESFACTKTCRAITEYDRNLQDVFSYHTKMTWQTMDFIIKAWKQKETCQRCKRCLTGC